MAATHRWNWLQAMIQSDLPSVTRLVLHTLAMHMDRYGADCFPGLTRLARESGLDRKTVRRHLAAAEDSGWIVREQNRRSSGAWGTTRYVPVIPGEVGAERTHVEEQVGAEGTQVGAEGTQGGCSESPPRRGRGHPKTVETDNETDTRPLMGDESPVAVQGTRRDEWPAKLRKRNKRYDYHPLFEEAWSSYPLRHGSNPKMRAYKAFRARVKAGEDPSDLIAAAAHYKEHIQAAGKEGTDRVQQAATFWGPDEPFDEFVEGPGPPPTTNGGGELDGWEPNG